MAFLVTRIIFLIMMCMVLQLADLVSATIKTKSYGIITAPKRSRRQVREALGNALGKLVRSAARTVEVIGERQTTIYDSQKISHQIGRTLIAIATLQRLSADSIELLLDDAKKIRDCTKQQLEQAETVVEQAMRNLEIVCQCIKTKHLRSTSEFVPAIEALVKLWQRTTILGA